MATVQPDFSSTDYEKLASELAAETRESGKRMIAVVTGAGSGIGLETVRLLARHGINVFLADLCQDLGKTAALIKGESNGSGASVGYKIGDVTDEVYCRQVFKEATAQFGTPNALITCAGINHDGLSVKFDKELKSYVLFPCQKFMKILQVNLVAPVYWAMEFAKNLAEDRLTRGMKNWRDPSERNPEGTVVFIGSVVGMFGNSGQIPYAISKGALPAAAETLMRDWSSNGLTGIRCCVVGPGFTDTPMVRAINENVWQTKILPKIPLGHLIEPKAIALGIMFALLMPCFPGGVLTLPLTGGYHP